MKDGYIQIDKLSIPSEFDSLNKVEVLIDNVCTKLHVNEDYYGNVLVAVTEAVNNAIVHGNKSDENKEVGIFLNQTDNNLTFTVKDEGDGFDYSSLPDPTAPENLEKPTGRGVFLMKNLSDLVVFPGSRRDHGCLCLSRLDRFCRLRL